MDSHNTAAVRVFSVVDFFASCPAHQHISQQVVTNLQLCSRTCSHNPAQQPAGCNLETTVTTRRSKQWLLSVDRLPRRNAAVHLQIVICEGTSSPTTLFVSVEIWLGVKPFKCKYFEFRYDALFFLFRCLDCCWNRHLKCCLSTRITSNTSILFCIIPTKLAIQQKKRILSLIHISEPTRPY